MLLNITFVFCTTTTTTTITTTNNNKLILRQYPQKESNSVANLIQVLDKRIVQVQCKVHQQMVDITIHIASL